MHWRRRWQPTPVFLPGESQGQQSLVGCGLWGRTESDTTEATQQQQQQGFPSGASVKNPPANAGDVRDVGSIHGSKRSPGGGHGNPLQCSCLENPRDRGAWWAAVYGVAQSRTQLKRRSSSSSRRLMLLLHSPTLTSIHDHWKNHSLDKTDICWQSNVSAFEYAI